MTMIKKHLRFLAGLLLLGLIATSPAYAFEAADVTTLRPDPALSFATATETQIVVGLVGEGWAIRFTIQKENQLLHSSLLKTGEVSFIRGPRLDQYIRPSAGPPTPPLPKSAAYSVVALSDITITSGGLSFQAPKEYLDLALSRFEVEGKWFELDGKVRLPLGTPLP